jgi:hypothetical protein
MAELRKLKKDFDRITEGPIGYLVYAALGILIAFLVNASLAFALSTDLPVVAVMSDSMTHDNTVEVTHYQWLEKNMGYGRNYIDSWPIKDGFLRGDLPIIQGVSDYKVGDVVVYSPPGGGIPIIHRIIKINSDGTYTTKGDHNLRDDVGGIVPKPISKEQIHGKVIFIIPKLGYFKVILTDILGVR